MVTIDASVWVAADASDESAWKEARTLLQEILKRGLQLHQPTLTLVEVSSALARRSGNAELVRRAGLHLLRFPGVVFHPLDLELTGRSAAVAAQARLRGADAIYAATALRHGTTLLTLDRELCTRAADVVSTMWPAEWLEAGG